MREIKFRVWDIKRSRFVVNCEEFGSIFDVKNGILELNESGYSVYQQFTSLKDKNEVEIYEGDIVKYTSAVYSNDNVTGYVIFDEGSFLNKISNSDIRGLEGGEDSEVIGNILENKELLNDSSLLSEK